MICVTSPMWIFIYLGFFLSVTNKTLVNQASSGRLTVSRLLGGRPINDRIFIFGRANPLTCPLLAASVLSAGGSGSVRGERLDHVPQQPQETPPDGGSMALMWRGGGWRCGFLCSRETTASRTRSCRAGSCCPSTSTSTRSPCSSRTLWSWAPPTRRRCSTGPARPRWRRSSPSARWSGRLRSTSITSWDNCWCAIWASRHWCWRSPVPHCPTSLTFWSWWCMWCWRRRPRPESPSLTRCCPPSPSSWPSSHSSCRPSCTARARPNTRCGTIYSPPWGTQKTCSRSAWWRRIWTRPHPTWSSCRWETKQSTTCLMYSWGQKMTYTLWNLQNVNNFTKIRGIMQNACLFSTDLNKMFTYVTQDHKTCHKGQFFKIEIYTSSENWINKLC